MFCLSQAYISKLKLEGFALMSDMVYAAWLKSDCWVVGWFKLIPNMDEYDQSWSTGSPSVSLPGLSQLGGHRFSNRPDESCVRSLRSVCDEAGKGVGMIQPFSCDECV